MVIIDKDILLAYQKNARELALRVTMNDKDVLTASQITDFNISETLSSDEKLSLGNTPCSKLTLNLIEPKLTTGIDNAVIKVEIGIKINDNVKYTNLGYFYESEHTTKNNGASILITAYDRMIKISDNGYYTCGISKQTVTPKEIVEDICKQSGVDYEAIEYLGMIERYSTIAKAIPIKYTVSGDVTYEDGYLGSPILPKFYDEIRIYAKEIADFLLCKYGDNEGEQFVDSEAYTPQLVQDEETGEEYWAVYFDEWIIDDGDYYAFSFKTDENCHYSLHWSDQDGQRVNVTQQISNPGTTEISSRAMLGLMAGLMGCNARINRNNKLEIVSYRHNYSIFSLSQYHSDGFSKNTNQELKPRYLVSGSENNIVQAGQGDYGYNFENEYINTNSLAFDVLSCGINKALNTVTGSIDTFFNPSVELGDVVLVENSNGFYNEFLVTENNVTVDGGINATLSNSLSKDSSDTNFSSPSTKTLSQVNDDFKKAYDNIIKLLNGTKGGYVKFVTDKAGIIRAIAITENDVSIEWDETENKVVTYNSGVSTNEAMWVWSYAGLAYTPNGGYSYRTAMTMEGDIYSNRLLSPIGLIAGFTLSASRMISSSSDGLHNGQIRGYDFNSNHNFLQIDYTDSNGKTTQPFVVNYDGTVEMTKGKIGKLQITEDGLWLPNQFYLQYNGSVQGKQLQVRNSNAIYLTMECDGEDTLIDGTTARDLLIRNNNRNLYLITGTGDIILRPRNKIRLDGSISLDSLVGQASNGDYLVYLDGGIGLAKSSRKYKKNIKDVDKKQIDYEALYNLPIRQFEFKDGIKGSGIDGVQIGFIADEVADVFPNAALRNDNGEPSNWTERTLIPAMLKLIQEQKKSIDDLTARIEKLEEKLKEA